MNRDSFVKEGDDDQDDNAIEIDNNGEKSLCIPSMRNTKLIVSNARVIHAPCFSDTKSI